MENLDNLSSAEISNYIDQKEKELSKILRENQFVEQEKLVLQRKILEIQMRKKDAEIALSKSGHIIKQLNIDIKLGRSKFWAAKDQGL